MITLSNDKTMEKLDDIQKSLNITSIKVNFVNMCDCTACENCSGCESCTGDADYCGLQ